MSEQVVGQLIADGRYEVIEKLGEGAMGEVYRARQVAVGRLVALKLIHSASTRSTEVAARFQREMKLSAKIEHANTIRVYDFGTWQGQLYIAMELVRGKSLRAELEQSGPLPLARIVRIATQVARGLSAAHAEDVVHRDLKPDNVMLVEQYGERDLVKVLDFGIAKSLSEPDEARMTGQGAIIGTPQYMSPEQSMGQRLDERSDLYSLGIMLFEMATGRVPFDAPSITAMLVAHATQEPPALASVLPDVHPGLAQLVSELLQKDPNARPRSAQEVEARLNALAPAQASSLDATPAPSPSGSAPAPAASGRPEGPRAVRGLLWVMLISLLMGGGTVAFLWAQKHAPSSSATAVAPPPVLPESPTRIDLSSEEPKPWEIAMLGDALQKRLAEAGIPDAPGECAGEQRLPAAVQLLTARNELDANPSAALEASTQSLEYCGSWAATHNVRGNALQRLDRLDEAVKAYREALRLQPDYDAPRFNLGVVQLRRKDAAAIATFSGLVKQKPDYPDVYASRAQAYLFAKRYREGLADLERAVEQDASAGTVWLMLGQVRERLKKPGASEAYCKALDLGVEAAREHCQR
jgi:serine/threonine protein kinase/Tfp pilus assembly protein PilF